MSETGRPTALGVARARFVEGLPRKATELRASTALLFAAPGEERPREELRRRLHALWASAQVFQIEALCDALKDAIERLDRARDQRAALQQDDLDALAALSATLPLLGNKTVPGAPAIPSTPPSPALLRTSSPGTSAPRLRPPKASGRPTLVGIGQVPMPTTIVELETVCTVAVLAPEPTLSAVRAAFEGDPRIEIHAPDPGESAAAFVGRCGPDAILTSDAVDAAGLREIGGRIGAIVRVLGAEVTGGLPAPTQRDEFSRALKIALRALPSLEPSHIAARLSDLEAALLGPRDLVSNRFDGVSIAALFHRIESSRPDATIHLRDAYDAIDAEMRGGQLLDVIRTANDGWYSRGAAAVVPLLGMRRGLVSVERAHGPTRKTLPDPSRALRDGRERLVALERATRPAMIAGIAAIDIDTDAAPSAKKERAVDARLIDAVVRMGSVAPLLEGGTSREGLSAALLALARSGALLGVRGPAGEDRIAEAIAVAHDEPPPSEPEIRTLTQVPPPPDPALADDGDDEDDPDEADQDEAGQDEAGQDEAEEDRARAAATPDVRTDASEAPTQQAPAAQGSDLPRSERSREIVARADTVPAPVPSEPPVRSPPSTADVATLDEDDDDDRPAPLVAAAPEHGRREQPAPEVGAADPPAPQSSSAFGYALAIALLFVVGFVLWRVARAPDETTPPAAPDLATSSPPSTSIPPATDPDEAPVENLPEDLVEDPVGDPVGDPVEDPAAPTGAGAFGERRANHAPPASGMGWAVAVGGWRVDGRVLSAEPIALPVGVHAAETTTEPARVRFVRVTSDSTVVLGAL